MSQPPEPPKPPVDIEDVSARGLNAVMIMALGVLLALAGIWALSDGFRTALAAYASLPEPAKRKLDSTIGGATMLVFGAWVVRGGVKQLLSLTMAQRPSGARTP
jgi:hypothetical protein